MKHEKRNVGLLALCQVFGSSCMAVSVAIMPLSGALLAPDPWLATFPYFFQFLGLTLTTFPAAILMQKLGRRLGFSIGALMSIAGGLLATLAMIIGNFYLLCISAVLFGLFIAFVQQYRFAAAQSASPDFRARAISYTLAGGVAASLLGPELSKLGYDALPTVFAGAYLVWVLLGVFSLIAVQFLRIPVRRLPPPPAGDTRAIMTSPVFILAVSAGALTYGIMNFIMTATPLSMSHHGYDFTSSTFVIQWHVFAMFAPSFFTGSLIDRFGIPQVMIAGAALMILVTPIALAGTGEIFYFAALLILGIAWNFLYIGATTVVGKLSTPNNQQWLQGCNDFVVFGVAALSVMFSGIVLNAWGWEAVASMAVVAGVLNVCAAMVLVRRQPA